MRTSKSHLVALSILFVLIALPVAAQQVLPPVRVTIYKGGFAHVIREGELRFTKRVAIIDNSISPLLGTYWLSGEKSMSIQFVVDTVKVKRTVGDYIGLISANVGKRIKMLYVNPGIKEKDGDRINEVEGTLVSVMSPGLLKIKTVSGSTLFLTSNQMQILSLELVGEEANTFVSDSIYRVAKVIANQDQSEQDVQLHYLGTGFTWHPSYYLRLLDKKTARLEMKALVENFATALDNVEADLVIGSPQLAYGNTMDPITASYYMASLNTPNGGLSIHGARGLSNALRVAASDDVSLSTYFEPNYETAGDQNQDLFHYKLGKISIPLNAKVQYPIFAEKVDYDDRYEVQLSDHVSFQQNRAARSEPQEADVYHIIKVRNKTSYPFTTAPIVVESEKMQFLAQDQLPYTSRGRDARVKLGKAPDISVKNTEEEISRTEGAETINSILYYRAKVKGRIDLRNSKEEAVMLDVTKFVAGEISSADGGKQRKTLVYGNPNPSSEMKWEVPLAAGEAKSIEYSYTVLFPAR